MPGAQDIGVCGRPIHTPVAGKKAFGVQIGLLCTPIPKVHRPQNEKGTCVSASAFLRVVRLSRFELLTSCLSSKRSEPTELKPRLGLQRYNFFRILKKKNYSLGRRGYSLLKVMRTSR